MALLEVRDLTVHFATEDGLVKAVDGVSYEVDAGDALGIVGESGSGKSVSSLTVMGLTRAGNAQISGSVRFDGRELLTAPAEEMRTIRGGDVAMIFQDPLSSLHPFYKVGKQLAEARMLHSGDSKRAAKARAIELLDRVGIPDPKRRADSYPHEFSGGMRQRVMIAMALINDPKLLIADEPTTALDVTVQAQILELISELQRESGTAVVMITHDLGVVAEVTRRIAVMYAGRIVEQGSVTDVFGAPEHPYSWGLLRSIPRLDTPRDLELEPIPGRPPSLINRPSGCAFHPRCAYAFGRCRVDVPALEPVPGDGGHAVACHLEPRTRRELWRALGEGAGIEEAKARAGAPGLEEGAV